MELQNILRAAHDADASDVHLVAGHPPTMRVHQVITPMDFPIISKDDARRFFEQMAPRDSWPTFDRQKDLDFSYSVENLSRYRVNAHMQRGAMAMALRGIKSKVPPLEKLNLPKVIERLTYLPRGLVLVTGDTGSGKSTTLAAMIEGMNTRYRKHIITLEDPVEYAFKSDKCLLEQRELGADMPSFASGLKHALRQDPDIILVGEMRDPETTGLAISAAETGHLVLSTLHTVNASPCTPRISRIRFAPCSPTPCRPSSARRSSPASIARAWCRGWKSFSAPPPCATSSANVAPLKFPTSSRPAAPSACSPWTVPSPSSTSTA
jgi:twitching motility protein PilT